MRALLIKKNGDIRFESCQERTYAITQAELQPTLENYWRNPGELAYPSTRNITFSLKTKAGPYAIFEERR